MNRLADPVDQYEIHEHADEFLTDALEGLRRTPKKVSAKYLYDKRGSELFDAICQLDEYYPTRTETGILRECAAEMAECLGPRCLCIEYGSGSSTKTHLLLDALIEPAGYVPVDISREHLIEAATRIAQDYPKLHVIPVCADFAKPFNIPQDGLDVRRRIIFFPGSTIGNFDRAGALSMLRQMAGACGPTGGVLIGVDLKKDIGILEAAYNDAENVTAEFNLNLLRRMNEELGANFDLDRFEHQAVYNEEYGRVEMHLRSLADQTVVLDGQSIEFREGETIHTESSHKYALGDFREMAAESGLSVQKVWTDPRKLFSVQYLIPAED